jgi:hypothetical protein
MPAGFFMRALSMGRSVNRSIGQLKTLPYAIADQHIWLPTKARATLHPFMTIDTTLMPRISDTSD